MALAQIKLLIVILSSVLSVQSNKVPFIKPCLAEDSKCARDSAQVALPILAAGVPELGIGPADPLFFDKLDSSSSILKLVFQNVEVKGPKQCHVKKLQRDVANSKIFMKVQCPIQLKGDYELNGQLLLLPIYGKGKCSINIRKIQINVEADIPEVEGADGKKHWEIKHWKHTFELQDKADLLFDNLFDGNEVLSKAILDLAETNSKEIITEIGPPIVEGVTTKIIDSVKILFSAVPIEELVLK